MTKTLFQTVFTVILLLAVLGCAPPSSKAKPAPTPQITVSQSLAQIPNNTGGFYFGIVVAGSASNPIIFTIGNSGKADLTINMSLTDPAGDFDLLSTPSATIAPSASSSFTIQFNPLTTGTKTATIQITNNDPARNPYTIQILGIGAGTDPGSLQGTIVDSIGGAPVTAAAVVLEGTGWSATTDANGQFNIANITPGTYNVIASKAGMAGSKLQAVDLLPNTLTKVELIQTAYSFSNANVTPPTLYVGGIMNNGSYSGNIPIIINATSGSISTPIVGTFDHASIYKKIDSASGLLANSSCLINTLSYTWNSALYPPGIQNIKVVAYDNNNNRSEVNIPVNVGPKSGSAPPNAPLSANDDYEINATTSGRSFGIYNTEPIRILADEKLGTKERIIKRDASIMSAQTDSSVLVDFIVDRYTNTTGINVYRSSLSGGPYSLVGGTANYYFASWRGCNSFEFIDCSADLTPESTYYYKIAYFNQYGKGPDSAEISVRILPKYNLNLVTPANNSATTDNTPHLSWLPDNIIAGATRTDLVQVRDALTYSLVYSTQFTNGTTQVDTTALSYGKLYEWNVTSQYGYSNYYRDSLCYVLSVSIPSTSNFSTNGSYYFSVEQP